MTENFKTALQDFAFEAACGGAIRHLRDLGLSPAEIEEKLDYPVPLSRIEREVAAYDAKKAEGDGAQVTYRRVYGKYGRAYLQRVREMRS